MLVPMNLWFVFCFPMGALEYNRAKAHEAAAGKAETASEVDVVTAKRSNVLNVTCRRPIVYRERRTVGTRGGHGTTRRRRRKEG
jgi:deoxyribose-phosphate aldolase